MAMIVLVVGFSILFGLLVGMFFGKTYNGILGAVTLLISLAFGGKGRAKDY